MVGARRAIAIAPTAFLQKPAVRALVSTNTGTITSGGLTSEEKEEKEPSHHTRQAEGSLAREPQEAAPALARASGHSFRVAADLG
jgi:hypothetical protein